MTENTPTDCASVEYLLAEIIDSFEKLDLAIELYRSDLPQSASALASKLELPISAVIDALLSLAAAGVVRRARYDTASWVFDAESSWGLSMEILAALYDEHRDGLLRLMARCAFDLVRARERAPGSTVFLIAPRKQ